MDKDKLTEIAVNVAEIKTTLNFQAGQLESHIRRTELLETRLSPIEDHVKFVQNLIKVGLYIATIGSFVVGVLKLMRKM